MANVPYYSKVKELDDASAPARAAVKVTKATSDLPDGTCRGLWVGTAGTATMIDAAGNTLTDFPLQAGLNPISITRVSTGGTADDIWALY